MRRAITLALAAAVFSLAVPSNTAAAGAATFTFYGSGFGHGIGMSQWGAYGLASQGWSHDRILTHFYTGTKIQDTLKLPRHVSVGLTHGDTSIDVVATHGSARIWVGAPLSGSFVGSIPEGAARTLQVVGKGSFQVLRPNGSVVGGKRWGSSKLDVFVTYADARSRVQVFQSDQPGGAGSEYSHGYVELNSYGCATSCKERAILRIAFEQYLLGIGEVPGTWPMEALESQVDASRSYAAYEIARAAKGAACMCQVVQSDQTYVGWSKESGTGGSRWVAAVRATRGEVVTYKGALIQAFYAASDGGHSENVEDAWHGGDPRYAVPYLRGVCDTGEDTAANPWLSWSRSLSAADATARLLAYTGKIGTVASFGSEVRGVSGRIITIKVTGSTGSAVITGGQLEAAMGLPDDRVYVGQDENILGAIRTVYDSWNCKPGAPSTPVASVTGGSFQTFAHGGIFQNSGAGLTVWVRGVTYDEYVAVGGAAGTLGLPITDVVSVRPGSPGGCTGCKETDFHGGRIYVEPAAGSRALWGPVLATFIANGGPGGSLGYPTQRVQFQPDGSSSATFEHGSIACDAAGTCQIS
jgi:stage II sporulation protein D